jgi:hypothetical protein
MNIISTYRKVGTYRGAAELDPTQRCPGEINHNHGGRGVYFLSNDGHFLDHHSPLRQRRLSWRRRSQRGERLARACVPVAVGVLLSRRPVASAARGSATRAARRSPPADR